MPGAVVAVARFDSEFILRIRHYVSDHTIHLGPRHFSSFDGCCIVNENEVANDNTSWGLGRTPRDLDCGAVNGTGASVHGIFTLRS